MPYCLTEAEKSWYEAMFVVHVFNYGLLFASSSTKLLVKTLYSSNYVSLLGKFLGRILSSRIGQYLRLEWKRNIQEFSFCGDSE